MHRQVSGAVNRDTSRSMWPVMVLARGCPLWRSVAIFADLANDGISIRVDASSPTSGPSRGRTPTPSPIGSTGSGMRVICVPLLLIGAIAVSRRIGSIRAVLIASVGTLRAQLRGRRAQARERARESPHRWAGDVRRRQRAVPLGTHCQRDLPLRPLVALLDPLRAGAHPWRRRLSSLWSCWCSSS